MSAVEAPDEPIFSVVKGQPTDEELAALVAVLAAAAPPSGSGPIGRASGWSSYRRSVRAPVHPGPQAWRLSGRQ